MPQTPDPVLAAIAGLREQLQVDRDHATEHRQLVLQRLEALGSVDAEVRKAVGDLSERTATQHSALAERMSKVESDVKFGQGQQSAFSMLASGVGAVGSTGVMLFLWWVTGGRTPFPTFGSVTPVAISAPVPGAE